MIAHRASVKGSHCRAVLGRDINIAAQVEAYGAGGVVPTKPELSSQPEMEVSIFKSLSVPKVRVVTTASLGFRNERRCHPGRTRLRNHPDFARKILTVDR